LPRVIFFRRRCVFSAMTANEPPSRPEPLTALPHDEESHEAIWSSMATVTIRDCAAGGLGAAAQQGPVVIGSMASRAERLRAAGLEGEESDSSESTSDASDESERLEVLIGSHPNAQDTAPSTRAPSSLDEDVGVMLQDLVGRAGGADVLRGEERLPSLEDERRRLADIRTRQQAVRDIAARYTHTPAHVSRDIVGSSQRARPKEVIGCRLLPHSGEGGGAERTAAVCEANDAIDVTTFTSLDVPLKVDCREAETESRLKAEGAKYLAVAGSSKDEGHQHHQMEESCEPDGEEFANPKAEGQTTSDPCQNEPTTEAANALTGAVLGSGDDACTAGTGDAAQRARPWVPAHRLVMGPSARPGAAAASFLLGRLGERLREHGDATRLRADTPADAPNGANVTPAALPAPVAVANSSAVAAGPPTGTEVVLHGLSRPELNGLRAVVLPSTPAIQKGRVAVRTFEDTARRLSVRIENVKMLHDQEAEGQPRESGTPSWRVSEERLRRGRAADESRREELWHQFLAGDDRPVGGDALPPPELYYGRRDAQGEHADGSSS